MTMALKIKLDWQGWQARVKLMLVFNKPELPDVILTAGTVGLVVVCLGLLGVPAYTTLKMRAKSAAVVGNAATLQLAAESYAAVNQGRYAEDALDLLPYLPADSAPVNPYTDDEIVFLGAPGDLTYRSPTRGRDYVIQAFAMGPNKTPRLVKTLAGR
jgi:hypothetical protein